MVSIRSPFSILAALDRWWKSGGDASEWHPHQLVFRSPIAIDGTRLKEPYVMRRYVDGKWQYRRETREEAVIRAQSSIW